jgi:hypothetical protein
MNQGEQRPGTMRRGITGLGARFYAPMGAVAVLALLLMGTGAAGACGSTTQPQPTVLTTIPLISTVVANTTNVFAQGETNCTQIYSIDAWGNVKVYATLPNQTNPCSEGALALVPTTVCVSQWSAGAATASPAGAWGNRGGGCGRCQKEVVVDTLYDALNGVLYEITQGGSNVTAVGHYKVPANETENMGLTWDQVGNFSHDLIVTSSSGTHSGGWIWLFNTTTQNSTELAYLDTYLAGPAIAPTWFGSYSGDILIGDKTSGQVLSITPSATVTVVTNWTKALSVAFPSSPSFGGTCGGGSSCSFGHQHYVFFVANYSSGALEAFPASDFRHFGNQGMVAGGVDHGIASFTSSGTTTLFLNNTQRLSEIAFVTCFPDQNNHGGRGWGTSGGFQAYP